MRQAYPDGGPPVTVAKGNRARNRRRARVQPRRRHRAVHRVVARPDPAAGRVRDGVRGRRLDRRYARAPRPPLGGAPQRPRHPHAELGLGRAAPQSRDRRGPRRVHPVRRPGRRACAGGPRAPHRHGGAERLGHRAAQGRQRLPRGRAPRVPAQCRGGDHRRHAGDRQPDAPQAAADGIPARARDPVPGGSTAPRGPAVHGPSVRPRPRHLHPRGLSLLPVPAARPRDQRGRRPAGPGRVSRECARGARRGRRARPVRGDPRPARRPLLPDRDPRAHHRAEGDAMGRAGRHGHAARSAA